MQERIVVDTSVMVSALIGKRGPAREVLRLGMKGAFLPLISNPLFQEYESVAHRREVRRQCPLSPQETRELLNAWYSCCHRVPIYYLWRPNLPDEDDNFLFELGVAGNADLIITQNTRDMKPELAFPELRITTPAQYLRGKHRK